MNKQEGGLSLEEKGRQRSEASEVIINIVKELVEKSNAVFEATPNRTNPEMVVLKRYISELDAAIKQFDFWHTMSK